MSAVFLVNSSGDTVICWGLQCSKPSPDLSFGDYKVSLLDKQQVWHYQVQLTNAAKNTSSMSLELFDVTLTESNTDQVATIKLHHQYIHQYFIQRSEVSQIPACHPSASLAVQNDKQ